MVVPVDNRSYMKKATDRAKTRKLNKKKKNNNLGAAPSKLGDNTAIRTNRSLVSRLLGNKSGKLINDNADGKSKSRIAPGLEVPLSIARPGPKPVGRRASPHPVSPKPKPVKSPSSTSGVGVKGKSKAKPFIEDEGGQGRASSDFKTQGMISKARNSTKASAPKPVGRRASPHPVSPKPKPAVPAPAASAAPKKAPKIAPRPRPKPSKLTGGGMDAELLNTSTGVTSGRVKKTARSSETSGEGFDPGEFKTTAVIKSDPTEGGRYAFTPKDSKSIMGLTQEGYDEVMEDSSGEKAGGRPGRGKLKTQGMNKAGKRKAGFSGKGAGAALRGF